MNRREAVIKLLGVIGAVGSIRSSYENIPEGRIAVELCRGWSPAENELTEEELTMSQFRMFRAHKNAHRKWIANEQGGIVGPCKSCEVQWFNGGKWERIPDGLGEMILDREVGVYFAGDAPPREIMSLGNRARIRMVTDMKA